MWPHVKFITLFILLMWALITLGNAALVGLSAVPSAIPAAIVAIILWRYSPK